MPDEYSIRVRLIAEIQSYKQGLQQASTATAEFGRNVSGMGDAASADIERVGHSALLMSAGLAAGLALSAKAAIDWESAWAGVTKTVDGTAEQMAELEDGLRQMATELPSSHAEIAGVAEAAGQLGVAAGDIEQFTRVMIDLGETTNLTADEAATSIAQMMNIMQSAPEDVERLASTLVLLGNNGASTEREILDMSLRLAGAGELIGATEGEVLALANTMASLGIESQLGGGAMSRTILEMYNAVQEGGEILDVFAETANMTADEFAAAFRSDPVAAIDEFIQGMGEIQAEGGNLVAVLQDVGLSGTQDAQVLLRLAGAGDLLTQSLVMQEQAWQENTALAAEAEKRYATTAAQMEILRNQLTDLAISIGEKLLPAINGAVDLVSTLVTGFSALPGPLQTAGVLMAGFATVATGAVGIIGTLAPKVMQAQESLRAMGTAGQFAARNMRNLATAGGAVGAAFTAFALYQGLVEEATRAGEEFAAQQKSTLDAITDYDELGAAAERAREGVASLRQDADASISPFDGDYRAQLYEGADALEDVADAQEELLASADALSRSQNISTTEALALVRAQEAMAASSSEASVDLDAMAASMSPEQTAALASELGVTEEALNEVASATEAADEAFKEYQDTLHASLDPLFGAIDALDGLEEAQRNVTAAEWAIIEAQEAYNVAAREHGRNSEEARIAALDLYAAQEDLVTANRDVVDSAFAVDEAMTGLRIGIETGGVSVEEATGKLRQWVEQGTITQAQADAVAQEFLAIDEAAKNLDGRNVTMTISTVHQDIFDRGGPQGLRFRASGGPVMPGNDYIVGEKGPELLSVFGGGGGMVYSANSPATSAALSGGGRSSTVNLNVQGTKLGPGEIDILGEQLLRRGSWALSLEGVS